MNYNLKTKDNLFSSYKKHSTWSLPGEDPLKSKAYSPINWTYQSK